MCLFACEKENEKCLEEETDTMINQYVNAVTTGDHEMQFKMMIDLLLKKADRKHDSADIEEFKNCLHRRLDQKLS